MYMNFYTLASKLNKKMKSIEKDLTPSEDTDYKDIFGDPILLPELNKDRIRSIAEQRVLKEFDENCAFGILLMERYKNMIPKKSTGHYMITVRPDENKIQFRVFKTLVEKYVRKKMINYSYSFEQKGTTEEDIGKGFHVHIIGTIRQRDKTTCLAQTCNFFADCTAANCIQVDYCSHPEATIQNYLVDYESEDAHKIVTKNGDELWRREENIEWIYSNNLSSPGRLLV